LIFNTETLGEGTGIGDYTTTTGVGVIFVYTYGGVITGCGVGGKGVKAFGVTT
jgi:hypothetical protein